MYSDIPNLPPFVLLLAECILAVAMLLTGFRIWRGPSIPDRIVALDLLAALIMAQFVVMVFFSGFISYLDVATVIAVISFIATIAFARCLENKEGSL
ncbi:MAG: multicomponent Na+:H+ antiporter subunit F [Zhongshania aliphaticivorans]|jgi:multicomponent Na+:H+ antiporter subunit F